MINYQFIKNIPYAITVYEEEFNVIQTFLENPEFPTLKLSYPTVNKARSARTQLVKYVKTRKINLKVTQRALDIYIVKTNFENKGE